MIRMDREKELGKSVLSAQLDDDDDDDEGESKVLQYFGIC